MDSSGLWLAGRIYRWWSIYQCVWDAVLSWWNQWLIVYLYNNDVILFIHYWRTSPWQNKLYNIQLQYFPAKFFYTANAFSLMQHHDLIHLSTVRKSCSHKKMNYTASEHTHTRCLQLIVGGFQCSILTTCSDCKVRHLTTLLRDTFLNIAQHLVNVPRPICHTNQRRFKGTQTAVLLKISEH